MLFSVVIPTYNRVHLLPQALESVFAQTFTDYEVIVVDDGSTDATCNYLESLGPRVTLVKQDHRGPGAARNRGVQNASGEYITFLDSDDLWFPWTLMHLKIVIEQVATRPSFISGATLEFNSQSHPHLPAWTSPTFKCFPDYLGAWQHRIWVGTCSTAILRREFDRVGGFSEEKINAEDSDLWIRLGTLPGYVHILSPPQFAYRRHEESAVRHFGRTLAGTRKMMESEQQGCYPGGVPREKERKALITSHVRPVSIDLLRRGHCARALRLYRQSFGWHLRLRRWKYLATFPMLLLASSLGYRNWRF